jgi:hypothetical protein
VPVVLVNPSPLVAGSTGAVSSNWSGYVATGKSQSFTDVRAKWKEPALKCSPTLSTKNDDAFWIGLDGFSNGTVEQTGTEGLCKKSTTKYDAWIEMFPKNPFVVFDVKAGDEIFADVTWLKGSNFSVTIEDMTSGKKVHKMLPAQAKRSSAEWIAETSSLCSNCLENFGSVTFTGATASANGVTGGIAKFPYKKITMASNKTVMAQPSALEKGGTTFRVVWKAPGASTKVVNKPQPDRVRRSQPVLRPTRSDSNLRSRACKAKSQVNEPVASGLSAPHVCRSAVSARKP